MVAFPVFAQEPLPEEDPPEIVLGERLFLETRFAQFFFANSTGANTLLAAGDPVLEDADDPLGILPPDTLGPFAGFSMNCRACHFVDDLLDGDVEAGPFPANGMRTYGDFSRRSRIPAREDGLETAPRNSPPLVGSSLFNLNHFDAEFDTMADLVKATLTGRNYGWLPTEEGQAFLHIANVIRTDDGTQPFAGGDFVGESYTNALANPDLGPLSLDVNTATDEEIFEAVAQLIAAYVIDLGFSRDDNAEFNLSPYDAFLAANGLDRSPSPGESPKAYSQRLLGEINELANPVFISGGVPGPFKFHDQGFSFGQEELDGLKIFFAQSGASNAGNCVSCHPAPVFSDLNFHNIGTAQIEYDKIHGDRKFKRLYIPGLRKRLNRPNRYLPATSIHPEATGIFRSVPSAGDRRLTDLGLWNIFANPDFPKPQRKIWETLCEKRIGESFEVYDLIINRRLTSRVFRKCNIRDLLPKSIALFKTPSLRDLGHSAPFMHNGQFDTMDSVILFYMESSDLARSGKLRNGDPEMRNIKLTGPEVTPLTRFLKALNEDYE